MASYLFFDDQRLFARDGLTREMGQPQLIPDSLCAEADASVSGAFPHVWRENEHSYHLFYQAFDSEGKTVMLAAHGTDGVHFAPRNTAREAGISDARFPNQLLGGPHAELGCVFEDARAASDERLKALVCEYGDMCVFDRLYVSGDGVRWRDSGVTWHKRGTEPGVGCLYSEALGKYVILARPCWGVRRLCSIETADFRAFTEPQMMLQADSLDAPLTETYGLQGKPYKDLYVGFLWLYNTAPSDTSKFMGGTMDCQLVYSLNGRAWQRTLREPFVPRRAPLGGMLFVSDMLVRPDGEILIYASGTPREHGYFREPGAAMGVWRLREDGFMALRAAGEGRLVTRQTLLTGGFDINLACERATCAILDAESKPIEGFTHADCAPFSGDNAHWTPRFGRDASELKGRVVVIEIRVKNGRLYGINGDFVKMMNTEALRYERFGEIPDNKGFA